jgi:GMP synthase (glutamine-hydrolysing)
MLRILIADGTPAAMQMERERFGIPSNAALFEAALRSQQPDIQCSSINVADGEELPGGVSLGDFDGLMFSGSPLHINDRVPEVTRQIDFARAAFTTGAPIWGSCWGVQLATVTLGGSVRRNPRGRELGVARAITTSAAGRSHPLLATRPAVSTLSAPISTNSTSPRQARRCWLGTSFLQFRRWRWNCPREPISLLRNTIPSSPWRSQPD